jgi:asparagine synthase (glutamine-hydrolysing)
MTLPVQQVSQPLLAKFTPGTTTRHCTLELLHADDRMALNDGTIAAISGRPNWSTAALQATAQKKGPAAALMEAWQTYGAQLTRHFSGPCSFLLLSPAENQLLAGIDRLGQHTLYFCNDADQLFIGSTATAVNQLRGAPPAYAPQGLYNYFYFHMVPSPQSVYTGVSKLAAGHCLHVGDGKSAVQRYWTPPFQQHASASIDQLGNELKVQLRDAVERARGNAANCGSFLSGGLDSSTVTGMLAELSDRQCPAYAIGFDEPGYDEMEFARNTASHFGVELQEYYVTPENVMQELSTIASSYDEPFGNSSALPAYFCARRAREDGIDLLLAGDGGDEFFAGNERYAKQQVFEIYPKVPKFFRDTLVEPIIGLLPENFALANKARSYIEQANVPLPDRLQSYNYLNRMTPEDIFSADFLAQVDTQYPLELQRSTYHCLDQASDLDRMLYLDWQYTLADNDLRKVSRMCEVAGIDVRYPMLDEALVEFSCTVRDDWKLRRGNLRYFYKRSLSGWLPEATITKKKQGFGLPFGLWMQSYQPLSDLANDSLLKLKKRGYFRAEFIDRLIALHKDEHAAYYGEFIWILTIFELWMEGRSELAVPTG